MKTEEEIRKEEWSKKVKAYVQEEGGRVCEWCGRKPGDIHVSRAGNKRKLGFTAVTRPKYDNALKNYKRVSKRLYKEWKKTHPLSVKTQFDWEQSNREEIEDAYAEFSTKFENPNPEIHMVLCTICNHNRKKGRKLCPTCGKSYTTYKECYECHIKRINAEESKDE